MNVRAHEQIQVVSVIDPDNQSAGTVTGDWAAAKDYVRFLAVFLAGVLASNNTTDFSVVQAQDGSGTNAKALKAATQLTQAGTDSDKQVVISFRPEDLDLANGYTHVAVRATTATAAAYVSCVLLGVDPVYGYNAANDLASVDEVAVP